MTVTCDPAEETNWSWSGCGKIVWMWAILLVSWHDLSQCIHWASDGKIKFLDSRDLQGVKKPLESLEKNMRRIWIRLLQTCLCAGFILIIHRAEHFSSWCDKSAVCDTRSLLSSQLCSQRWCGTHLCSQWAQISQSHSKSYIYIYIQAWMIWYIYNEIYLQNLGEYCTGRRVLLAELLMELHEQVEQVSCRCHDEKIPTKLYRNSFPFRAFEVVAGAWGGWNQVALVSTFGCCHGRDQGSRGATLVCFGRSWLISDADFLPMSSNPSHAWAWEFYKKVPKTVVKTYPTNFKVKDKLTSWKQTLAEPCR